MEDAGFLVYVSEEDVRAMLEKYYPGTEEVKAHGSEDLTFEHKTNGVEDLGFQVWKYTHPDNPDIWVVSKYTITVSDEDTEE